MNKGGTGLVLGAAGLVGVMIVAIMGLVFAVGGSTPANACGAGSGVGATVGAVEVTGVPAQVGRWDHAQLLNAAAVIGAGQQLSVPLAGQVIGVMTAMGESSLTVLDYGDAAGPDSRGLFQQRANGAWGSLADRLDPTISSLNFFKALLRVPGWQGLPPTIAAHEVQGNADPYYYMPFYGQAVQVVAALSGVTSSSSVTGLDVLAAGGMTSCDTTAVTGSSTVVWPVPTALAGTDEHNWGGVGPHWGAWHTGTDFAVACGTPVYAATAGTIVVDTTQAWAGKWLVKVETGPSSVTTWYAHMEALHVSNGQTVAAGQQIGDSGDLGNATGCHLHFEVHLHNGTIYGPDNTNPSTWLEDNVGKTVTTGDGVSPAGSGTGGTVPGSGSSQPTPGTTPGSTTTSPTTSPATGPTNGGIVVATFNVLGSHLTGHPGAEKPTWPTGPARMAAAVQLLDAKGVSLVTLQEFETPAAQVLANSPGWTVYRATPNNTFRDGNTNGDAIAWRTDDWTLISAHDLLVPWTITRLHMPVLVLQYKPTGQLYTVMGVHNPASTKRQGDQAPARVVARRLELATIRAARAAGQTVILGGDFNERAPAYCAFTNDGLLTSALGPEHPRPAGAACRTPFTGVDQLFAGGATIGDRRIDRSTITRQISDHAMVTATVG